MKSKPIIIFSESSTPNWPETDCDVKSPKPVPSIQDLKNLEIYNVEKSVKKIVTTTAPSTEFSALAPLGRNYVTAGATIFVELFLLIIFIFLTCIPLIFINSALIIVISRTILATFHIPGE